ncbi:MAG: hypothetical protein WBQ23_13385 [Bacteroidota bacterium]
MDGCYRFAFRRMPVILSIMFAFTGSLFAQADLEFRRITVDWPEVELAFVLRCDGTITHPTDTADVHILDSYQVKKAVSITNSGDETLVRYVPGCANGTQRLVFLAVTAACGTSPTRNLSYPAPFDLSTYQQLLVSLDTLQIPAGKSTYLPVRLQNSPMGAHIPQTAVRFVIDTTVSRITGAVAPSGTLLAGQPIDYKNINGAVVTFGTPLPVQDAGILFYLVMEPPARNDTACSSITVNPDLSNDPGSCISLKFSPGIVCSSPPKALLACEAPIVPDTLRWDAAAGGYIPAPFIYKAVVRNLGTADARSTVFRLIYNPADLTLQTGYRDTVLSHPSRIAPGATGDAEWRFDVPLKTASPFTTVIGVEVDYGSNEMISCSKTITLIRDSYVELRCDLSAPQVGWNEALHEYVPMPLPLSLTIENSGTTASDTVYSEVSLPPDLALAAVDAGMQRKVLTPGVLGAGRVGTTQWMLTHPVTATERQYEIDVKTWTLSGDTVSCSLPLTIPGAGDQPFAFSLAVTGETTFCEGLSVVLDGGVGYASWRWSTGDTTRTLEVRTSGQYWCEVRDATGLTGLSDTVRITVNPLPPVPVLTRDGDVLRSGIGSGYSLQWYRDSQLLAGETSDTLQLTDAGKYVLRVESPEGCSVLSDEFDVTVLTVRGPFPVADYILRSWPEPARDMLHIEISAPLRQSVSLLLVDLLGRSERLYDGVPEGGRLQFTVDLSSRPAGVWLLVMQSGKEFRVRAVTRM